MAPTIVYTTHYMEEAERLCDRIAIIDHGLIAALGTKEELVHNAFGSRSQVLARFAGPVPAIAAWVERRGGRMVDAVAEFTIERSNEIPALLDDAAEAGSRTRRRLPAPSQSRIRLSSPHRKGTARMILPIVRTAIVSLRRDRAALALSFLLPIAFFSIFAVIFGGQHDSTPKINLIVVDQDQSAASQQLVRALNGKPRSRSLFVPRRKTNRSSRTIPRPPPKPPSKPATRPSRSSSLKASDRIPSPSGRMRQPASHSIAQ